MMEVSDNGVFTPADDYEQCQDISGSEEDEERAEKVVCIGRNVETGNTVSVGSRGVEQEQEEETMKVHEADNQAETEHKERAEDQDYEGAGIDVKVEVSDRPARHNHLNKQDEMSDVQRRVKTDRDKPTSDDEQSGKKEKSSAEYVKEDEGLDCVEDKKGEIVADKITSEGGNEEADNQPETEQKQRAEYQDYGGAGIDEVKPVSDRHDHLNKQDVMSNVQRRVKTDRDELTAEDEQSGKKEKSSAEYFREDEGLDHVEDQRDKQEVGQDCGPQTVIVHKKGDEEKVEIDVKDNKKGEIVADKFTSGGGKLFTKYDLYRHEFDDNGRVSEQNMADDDRGCRRGCSHMCKIHEQQREERTEDKEQETKDDKQAQRRRTPTTKAFFDESLEGQDKRGLDDVRSKRPEQKISVNEDVSVEEQAKEQENKGHTQHNQNRESQRRAEWAERESTEKTGQKNSQSKERSGFKEVTEKGRGGSVQSRVVYVKTVEEEVEKTPSGNLRRTQTETIRIETSQDSIKSHVRPFKRNAEAKSNPKSVGQDTLSKGVSNLQLTESKKHGTKRSIESVEEESGTNTATDLNATKLPTESDTQDKSKKKGADGRKRKWWGHFSKQKQPKTRKKKKSKTPQCLSCFLMKTNAESD